MDSATAAVAGPNNHTIEKDTIEDGHSKEMTCTCETTGVQRPVSQNELHRMRAYDNRRPQTCFTCGGAGHTSAQCPSFGGRAHVHTINSNARHNNYSNYGDQSVEDIADDLQHTRT